MQNLALLGDSGVQRHEGHGARCAPLVAGLLMALLVAALLCLPRMASAQTLAPLGGGLNGQVDWSRDEVFVDMVKTTRGFGVVGQYSTNATTDANGWPTQDFWMRVSDHGAAVGGGVYKLSFEGPSTTQVDTGVSGAVLTKTTPTPFAGVNTYNVTVSDTARVLEFNFRNTQGLVKNIKCIRPGYDPANHPLFTDAYLNLLRARQPSVLRFMDFHSTNGNVEATWAERSLPTDATQTRKLTKIVYTTSGSQTVSTGKGICWEYSIALANELNKDMWINVPLLATDDYVQQLATLIKNNLNPGLNVYLEYSNEVWNDQFLQTHINRKLAVDEVAAGNSTLNYDGATGDVTWGDRRVAKRLKEMTDIFGQVFGAGAINARVRAVLAYQLVLSRFNNQLTFMNTVYGDPDDYFYAIAVAPYFACGNGHGADANPNLTKDQVLDALSASIDTFQNSNVLQDIAGTGVYYGLKMLAYEGGPDTFGPNNIAAKKAASLDPRMQALVVKYLNTWFSKGGGLFNWFVIGAGNFDSQYGTWSITDNLRDLNQPKSLGFDQVRTSPLPSVTVGFVPPTEIDARAHIGAAVPYTSSAYLRFLAVNSKFDYLLRVPTAGTYNLRVSLSTTQTGKTLDILLNNRFIANVNAPVSANGAFNDTAPVALNLTAGLNVVRLRIPSERPYDINSLKFTNADGSAINNTLPTTDFYAFSPGVNADSTYANIFNVSDAETPAANLVVTATSDNQTLVPNASILVESGDFAGQWGYRANRKLSVTPAAGLTGTANITLKIVDGGGLSRSITFRLTVTATKPPPTKLTATAGNQQVALSWAAPPAVTSGGTVSYKVYRGLVAGGEGTTPINTTPITATSFTDTGLSNGTTYYYVVTALNSFGESIRSNEASTAPFTVGTGTGLTAQYFNDPVNSTYFNTLALSRTDPTIDFNWGNGSPAAAVQADNFSVRWTGRVEAPLTGSYTFTVTTDDGVRFWLGNISGAPVIDKWINQSPTAYSYTVALTAGQKYPIKMEYYDSGSGAVARLHWSYPGQPVQAIPASQLFTPNRTPVAANDSYSIGEDNVLSVAAPGVLLNDTDADVDALSTQLVTGPARGVLALNANGSFTYTPSANFNGTDSFSYKVSDGKEDSNIATVGITISPVNDAPFAQNQSLSVNQNTSRPITLSASDPDNDALVYSIASGPAHGALSGTLPNPTYTPTANYAGPDSFTFIVNDGTSSSNVGTISLTVVATRPTVSSFAPASGKAGDSVTLNGTNLSGTSVVKLGSLVLAAGSYSVNSAGTQLSLVVPPNAITGKWSVTTPFGTATSATSFTVTSPAITSFSPSSGPEGTLVTFTGAKFSNPTNVRFNGVSATIVTYVSTSKLTAQVPPGATTGPIQITTASGESATSAKVFKVTPKITGFSPSIGAPGTPVTITGTSLGSATTVKFNGLSSSFTVVSPTQISAVVPVSAKSGLISVATPDGPTNSATQFIVAPRIGSFSPSSGTVGTIITLSGANFLGATDVRFNGVGAGPLVSDITVSSQGYQIVSSSQVKVKVPSGATSGKISLTTSAGTATSVNNFTVNQTSLQSAKSAPGT